MNPARHSPRPVFTFLCALTCVVTAAPTSQLTPHPAAGPNTHAPGEVDRPELVPFIVADPASLPGIVVDETAATLVGAWQYSTHTPPYVGLGYLHDLRADLVAAEAWKQGPAPLRLLRAFRHAVLTS